MKKGKIGSALAAFESNIAKNIEHGAEGSKSFLTGIATCTPPMARPTASPVKSSATAQRRRGSCLGPQSSIEATKAKASARRLSVGHGTPKTLPMQTSTTQTSTAQASATRTPPTPTVPRSPTATSGLPTSNMRRSHRKAASLSNHDTPPEAKSKRTSQPKDALPTTSNHSHISDARTEATTENSSYESRSPEVTFAVPIPVVHDTEHVARKRSRHPHASTAATLYTVASPVRRRPSIGQHVAQSLGHVAHGGVRHDTALSKSSHSTSSSAKQRKPKSNHAIPAASRQVVRSSTQKPQTRSAERALTSRLSPAPTLPHEQVDLSHCGTERAVPMKLSHHIDSSHHEVEHGTPKKLSLHIGPTQQVEAPLALTHHLTGKSICSDPVVPSSFQGLRVVEPQHSFSSLPLRPKHAASETKSLLEVSSVRRRPSIGKGVTHGTLEHAHDSQIGDAGALSKSSHSTSSSAPSVKQRKPKSNHASTATRSSTPRAPTSRSSPTPSQPHERPVQLSLPVDSGHRGTEHAVPKKLSLHIDSSQDGTEHAGPKKLSLHIDPTKQGKATVALTHHLTGKSICSDPVVPSSFRGLRVVEPQHSFSSLPLRPKNAASEAKPMLEASYRHSAETSQWHRDQERELLFQDSRKQASGTRTPAPPVVHNIDWADEAELTFPTAYCVSSPNKTTSSARNTLPFIPQSPASTCSSEVSFAYCNQVETNPRSGIAAPTTRTNPTRYQPTNTSQQRLDFSEHSLRDELSPPKRNVYPRSPMPTKALMHAIRDRYVDETDDNDEVESNYEGEASDTFHDSNSVNLMTKLSRVQTAKTMSFTLNSSSDDMSLCTLDINRRPIHVQKSTRHDPEDSSSNASSTLLSSHTSLLDINAVKSKYTKQVFSILRHPPIVRNTMRRVAFADQQPGGGRRMNHLSDPSNVNSSKRDAQPMRPRRSRQSTMDQLRSATSSRAAVPVIFIKDLAATKIQSLARQWIQWRTTRVTLLQRKLIRIETSREAEITRIRQQKWRAMDTMQSDITETEKRFESQVALGEKLMDHLKRDSTLIKGQNKKLQEFSQILKRNNQALESSLQQNNDNFFTMNIAIKLLREKSDTLLDESKRYANSVDKIQTKLQAASRQVDTELQSKKFVEQTIKRMLSLIKARSKDKQFMNHLSNLLRARYDEDDRLAFAGNGSFVMHDTESNEEPTAFDLSLIGHDNDDMSVFSDITDIGQVYATQGPQPPQPHQSNAYRPAFDVSADFTAISEGTHESSIHLHHYDDLDVDDLDVDDLSDDSESSTASGTSFASSYSSASGEMVDVVPSTPRKDSFADYTPMRVPNTPGNASAPRRHMSYEGSIR